MGASYNGSTTVSKTVSDGSIPSAPAKQNPTLCKEWGFKIFWGWGKLARQLPHIYNKRACALRCLSRHRVGVSERDLIPIFSEINLDLPTHESKGEP